MPLINCKIELKLKWDNYCVFFATRDNNTDVNPNNITRNIKYPKLYVPAMTLSAKDNQELSKLLSKAFERLVYWNNIKQILRIKIQQMNIDIFSNQTLLELIDYLY